MFVKVENFEENMGEFIEEIHKLGKKEVTIESGRLWWDGDAPGYTGIKFIGNKKGGYLTFWTYTDSLIDASWAVEDIDYIEEIIDNFIEGICDE